MTLQRANEVVRAVNSDIGADVAGSPQRRSSRVSLEIVIPIYNEQEVLPALFEEFVRTFSAEARDQYGLSEVNCLFVDDGSQDASAATVSEARPTGLGVTLLRLSRNFGHQAAVSAGIAHSSADLIAVIDADLQDPPGCILEMIGRWREGYEVVYGQRRHRQEGFLKRFLYAAFYRIYRLLAPIDVPVDAGDFCLLSRRAADELNRLPEAVRFPRGLRAWIGFPQTAVEYDRPARAAGESRYGWRDLYRLATEGIASLSLRPLQLSQLLALIYLLLAIAGISGLLLNVFDFTDLRTQLNLVLVITLVSNATVLFCMYILGAYLGRTYWEVKGRPAFIVQDVVLVKRASETEPESN